MVAKPHNGYTLIEILVSIAIMGIILGIVGFTYSLGKNYDTLNLENQRIASALRSVRNRDFNGVVVTTKVCSDDTMRICDLDVDCLAGSCKNYADLYPSLGYGIHIETNYTVCANDDTKSCFVDGDCSSGTCSVPSGKSSYTLFANISDSDADAADPLFDRGKVGREYIEEFKVPSGFELALPNGATKADITFHGDTMTILQYTAGWNVLATPPTYPIELQYQPGCTAQVKNLKGRVTLTTATRGLLEELVTCL